MFSFLVVTKDLTETGFTQYRVLFSQGRSSLRGGGPNDGSSGGSSVTKHQILFIILLGQPQSVGWCSSSSSLYG